MSKKKPNKCIPKKDNWCAKTSLVAAVGNPSATGLNIVDAMSSDYKKGKGLLLRFTQAVRKDTGASFAWIDFCPFCGADVSERTWT